MDDPYAGRGEYLWNDDEGAWADVGTGILGPFEHEHQAVIAAAKALIDGVSREVVNSRARQSQGWGADLNLAADLLNTELQSDTGGPSA